MDLRIRSRQDATGRPAKGDAARSGVGATAISPSAARLARAARGAAAGVLDAALAEGQLKAGFVEMDLKRFASVHMGALRLFIEARQCQGRGATTRWLPRVRVHDLKHTFGRRLRAASVSYEDRQDLLRHHSGRITTRYSAAELNNLLEAANRVCEGNVRKMPALVILKKKALAAATASA